MICLIKDNPSKDPKFHIKERFFGAGRSINMLLVRFNIIFDLRSGSII